MKLELKHLAPYLPYDLKIRNIDRKIESKYGIETLSCTDLKQGQIDIWNKYNCTKPILRPISEMPEDHLIELFLIAYNEIYKGVGLPTDDIVYLDFWGGDGDKMGLTAKQGDFIYGFSIDMENEFDIKFSYREERWGNVPNSYLRINKLTMFTHLFRLHYDMFKLIPAGLAIDINIINKKTP